MEQTELTNGCLSPFYSFCSKPFSPVTRNYYPMSDLLIARTSFHSSQLFRRDAQREIDSLTQIQDLSIISTILEILLGYCTMPNGRDSCCPSTTEKVRNKQQDLTKNDKIAPPPDHIRVPSKSTSDSDSVVACFLPTNWLFSNPPETL